MLSCYSSSLLLLHSIFQHIAHLEIERDFGWNEHALVGGGIRHDTLIFLAPLEGAETGHRNGVELATAACYHGVESFDEVFDILAVALEISRKRLDKLFIIHNVN